MRVEAGWQIGLLWSECIVWALGAEERRVILFEWLLGDRYGPRAKGCSFSRRIASRTSELSACFACTEVARVPPQFTWRSDRAVTTKRGSDIRGGNQMATRLIGSVFAAALVLVVVSAAVAQQGDDQAVELAYKWKAGDRYSFAVSARSQGKVAILSGEGAGQQFMLDVAADLTVFADVVEVREDGAAKIKVSFGMVGAQINTPQGQTMVFHLDPATGDVTLEGPGGQRNLVQKLPESLRQMMASGFTMTMTNKGKVEEVEGLDQLQAALRRIAGGNASPMLLNQLISWVEPPLPDNPVKPGDEWQRAVPWIFGAAKENAPEQLVMKFRYAGKSNVNGVECAKVEASMQVSGLDMSIEPGTVGPIGQQISGLSMQMHLTYYLNADTCHVHEAKGRISQSGTIRQYGTIEIQGREQNFDTTVQLDGLVTEVEVEATRD
ncbi:MAG: hypothetical protein H5T86_15560 [Armatimonadetes bacterium]|nr:hypothetical protein [Armatimonadota bacterium]